MDFLQGILASEEFLGLLGMLITAFIGWAATAFQRRTGIEIEAKHREALHQAIKTGVESAIQVGPSAAASELKGQVYAHLRKSVPDALQALTPGNDVLDSLIERYRTETITPPERTMP